MIDLMRLKAFIYAAESLSFSEAAKQLHLTQPTVSHHIKTLEAELDVELFTRSGHTLKLTEAVPVVGLDLQRTVYMVRRTLDTPYRPQEVFWSFVHDPSNADLLRLAGQQS